MPIASGIAKQLRYKLESNWGSPTYPTEPGASGAQLLRRKTSDLSLSKATLESEELRSDYQVADVRHGTRSAEGTIAGELSCKTYQDFMRAALRQPTGWTAAVTKTASMAVAVDGFTDAANGFITSGFKIGMVVRWTGLAGAASGLNNKNYLLVTVTANKLTGVFLDGTAHAVQAAASCTVTGFKFITAATTGHADMSFAMEHWFTDIAQSELYTGCKVNRLALKIPGSNKATIDLAMIGKDVKVSTSAYFTSPAQETTNGILTCLNGALYFNGAVVATITNCELNIDGGYQPSEAVLGSTSIQAVFPGRVRVTGQFSCYWENATFRDAFLNESTATLIVVLAAGSGGTDDCMSIMLPKIKLNGSAKDDGEKGLLQTIPFQALLDGAGGASAQTPYSSIQILDTAAI